MLLGVDVGGTFTDAVLVDPARGRVTTAKAPTTPEDQSAGVMAAVAAVLAQAGGRAAAEVDGFAHGMTVATNALLEGRVARTVLVATEGFTDVVELGRQARADHPATNPALDERHTVLETTSPELQHWL
jgi:N-methylhydantoinase A/oxoprolinase/acetone carboxylase beta subunit